MLIRYLSETLFDFASLLPCLAPNTPPPTTPLAERFLSCSRTLAPLSTVTLFPLFVIFLKLTGDLQSSRYCRQSCAEGSDVECLFRVVANPSHGCLVHILPVADRHRLPSTLWPICQTPYHLFANSLGLFYNQAPKSTPEKEQQRPTKGGWWNCGREEVFAGAHFDKTTILAPIQRASKSRLNKSPNSVCLSEFSARSCAGHNSSCLKAGTIPCFHVKMAVSVILWVRRVKINEGDANLCPNLLVKSMSECDCFEKRYEVERHCR